MMVFRTQIILTMFSLVGLLVFDLFSQIENRFDLNGALRRIQAYYQVKNFQQALEETHQALARDPENAALRAWELKLLLSRESFPGGTQFDVILEDVSYLDSLNRAGQLTQTQAEVLEGYRRDFADLEMCMSDAPAAGFFVVRIPLKFLPPIQLSPIQQARLEEINAYFQQDGRLYFDQIEEKTGNPSARLSGFPVLPQRLRTVRYRVAVATTGDTLPLPFNRRVRNSLELFAAHASEMHYRLPPNYILLFADRNLQIQPVPGSAPVFRKQVRNNQLYLIPVDRVHALHLGAPPTLKQQALFWGALASSSLLIWQLAR